MKIHEYQGKAILKKYGVTVPRGGMAESRDEAEAVARELLSSGALGVVVASSSLNPAGASALINLTCALACPISCNFV